MKLTSVKAAPEEVAKWWKQYSLNRDEDARNHLLENYLHIVKFTAERMHHKLPDEVEVDDLISAGIFGLMDAVKAFDPSRGDPRRAALDGLGAAPRSQPGAQAQRGHAHAGSPTRPQAKRQGTR